MPEIPNIKLIFEEKDINQKGAKISDSLPQEKSRKTAVSIDLTSLKAGYAPGVSEPNAVFGLTDESMK